MPFRLPLILALDDVDAATIHTHCAAKGAVQPSW